MPLIDLTSKSIDEKIYVSVRVLNNTILTNHIVSREISLRNRNGRLFVNSIRQNEHCLNRNKCVNWVMDSRIPVPRYHARYSKMVLYSLA